MKHRKKLAALAFAVSMLGLCIPFEALGATAKAITSVTLYAGLEELEAGDSLPSESSFHMTSAAGNYVYSSSSRYEVTNLEWITSTDKDMEIGAEPKIKVTLNAVDSEEYAFKGSYSSNSVSIKGGTYVSASRSGADTLYITFKFLPIKGTYSPPQDAYWKDSGYGGARWSAGEHSSDTYDVYLYRGSTVVKKVEKLKATSYNFYPYMTKAGIYSFKVRTVPYTESEQKYGKKSEWVDSEEIDLDQSNVSDGKGQDGNTPGDSSDGPGGIGGSSGTEAAVGWLKSGNSWYYRYPDGSYQKNSWAKINSKWYLFDTNGVMLSGWHQRNQLWYFMNNDGAMVTGWILFGNRWYYLNPSTVSGVEGAMATGWIFYKDKWYYTGSDGVMVEGWRQVGGNWYYFYPGEGSKAVNTVISSFRVDGDGIWRK